MCFSAAPHLVNNRCTDIFFVVPIAISLGSPITAAPIYNPLPDFSTALKWVKLES